MVRVLTRMRMYVASMAVAAVTSSSCASEQPVELGPANQEHQAGLFTPGSELGYEPPAMTPSDSGTPGPAEEPDHMERCTFSGSGTQAGLLAVSFGTNTYGGHYQPNNCGAVWVEDAHGRYVATLDVWAGVYIKNLFVWNARLCRDDFRPDAVSSATLEDHASHTVSWDGRSHTGDLVPDGSYALRVEVTEDEFDYGQLATFDFRWGPDPFALEPEDTASWENITIEFTPHEGEGGD